MPKRAPRIFASLVAASLLGWGPAAVAAPVKPAVTTVASATLSVGDFLLRYAKAMGLKLPEGAGPAEAVAALEAQGIVLESEATDLDRSLTEGDVVQFSSRIGLRLTTLNENRIFPAAKLDPFFDAFGGAFEDPTGSGAGGVTGTFNAGSDANAAGGQTGASRSGSKNRKKKKKMESPINDDTNTDTDTVN